MPPPMNNNKRKNIIKPIIAPLDPPFILTIYNIYIYYFNHIEYNYYCNFTIRILQKNLNLNLKNI